MTNKRRHDYDSDSEPETKKVQCIRPRKCFSFCIFNNSMYDSSYTNKSFEKRYVDGLINNIRTINNIKQQWSIVIYVDILLKGYYSNYHKLYLQDVFDHPNITIIYSVNKYRRTHGFALERFRPISSTKYDVVVVRDVDQLITRHDISIIQKFIDSEHDSLFYKCKNSYCCIGGGFATKITGQSYIEIEEYRHSMKSYLKMYPEPEDNGLGFEEHYIDNALSNKFLCFGKIRTVTVRFINDNWYLDNKLLFGCPNY